MGIFIEKLNKNLFVGDLLEEPKVVVNSNITVLEAQNLMISNNVSKAPVIKQNNCIGILDIMKVIKSINSGEKQKIDSLLDSSQIVLKVDQDILKIDSLDQELYPVVDELGRFCGLVPRDKIYQYRCNKLKAKSERFRLIVESVHNGIIAIDNKGEVFFINSAAEKMIGLQLKDLTGKHVKKFLPETELTRVLETGRSEYSQKVVVGDKIYISNRSPLSFQKHIVGAVTVFQDITDFEQISSELETVKNLNMELDTILNSSYDGLLITNEKGIGIKANEAFAKIGGLKQEDFIGKDIEGLYKRGVFHYPTITIRALKEGRRITDIQKVNHGKEALVTGNPVFDSDGKIIRVVTNLRDITELNRLREKLKEEKALKTKYYDELSKLKDELAEKSKVIIISKKVKEIYELAGRVALSEATVLILGESGVGKENLAKFIHDKSSRKGDFIQINCGAIPENLLESELFGYEPGAFTSANSSGKKGIFEMAHEGTIFLDEIGELALALQVKLLRVLQEHEFYRVGATKPIKLNVRIVAASNKDLSKMVDEGLFREDLFYRLNVVPLELPPLRERPEEIIPLILHYSKIFNEKYNSNKLFSTKSLKVLQNYQWPGNIRELVNAVERLIITSKEELIDTNQFIGGKSKSPDDVSINVEQLIPLKEAKEILEKKLIDMALKRYKTVRGAARVLGVAHSVVAEKVKKYKLRSD